MMCPCQTHIIQFLVVNLIKSNKASIFNIHPTTKIKSWIWRSRLQWALSKESNVLLWTDLSDTPQKFIWSKRPWVPLVVFVSRRQWFPKEALIRKGTITTHQGWLLKNRKEKTLHFLWICRGIQKGCEIFFVLEKLKKLNDVDFLCLDGLQKYLKSKLE